MIALPDYIDSDLWQAFIDHRKEIRHKLTPITTKFLLKKLAGLNAQQIDVNKAITQTIENGWQGIFAPRNDYGNQKPNGTKLSVPEEYAKRVEREDRLIRECNAGAVEADGKTTPSSVA